MSSMRSTKNKKLKILFVCPEVAPYVKVGGLADVGWALPRALKNIGNDIKVFTPKFGYIDEKLYTFEMVLEGLKVPFEDGEIICNVKKGVLPDNLEVYLLENQEYYELRANVYGYADDARRFALLSKAAIEFVKAINWYPDVIHANDWLSGLVPNYLKTEYKEDKKLQKCASVFTIHNLKVQGTFDRRALSFIDRDDGIRPIPEFNSDAMLNVNGIIRGVIYSDMVNTVSERYAKEILTADFGEGIDKLLTELRDKIVGIRNGVDYDVQSPIIDKDIYYNYDENSLSKKVLNKLAYQKEFDLEENPDIPLVGFVGRFDEQKGLALLHDTIEPLLKNINFQFTMVGGGDSYWQNYFDELIKKFPGKVGGYTMLNVPFAQKLYAASDIFIYPSKFEPCGIAQVVAMKYGSVPIVRETGGLADTVKNYDTKSRMGTGFVFKDFNEIAFISQLVRALELYNHKEEWHALMLRCMKQDFSWQNSAMRYQDLYIKALERHEKWLKKAGYVMAHSPTEIQSYEPKMISIRNGR